MNIHASLLPKYRGAGPIQWAIIDGEKETGITIQQMDKGVDTGDILFQSVVPIDAKETGESLFEKLAKAGAALIVEALPKIEAGEVTPRKQDESQASHAKMLQKSMSRIDWNRKAAELDCLIRGMISWPGASSGYHGKTLKIWQQEPVAKDQLPAEALAGAEPGTVIAVEKDAIYVQTGEGALKLTEVQLEGKKRMAVKDFLLGYPVQPGEMLA